MIRPIGRGGMGVVYEAWQESLQRAVAIKILPAAATLDQKIIDRFLNEARAAAMLDHPHIVPVYATGTAHGVPYFAMRLIDGESLEQTITRQSQADYSLNSTDLKNTFKQFARLADALQTAHEFGVIHRDIKPSNILKDKDGKYWIADFGLARIANADQLTRTGEMIGTVRYMSPEQALGPSETVDFRTDIYSLTATLFEVLTSRPMIVGDGNAEILGMIANFRLPSMRNLLREGPHGIDTLLERGTAKHKEDRYQSASALRDDLLRLANNEPIQATRISFAIKSARWASQNAVAVVATTLMMLLAIAWLVFSNLMIRQERDRKEAYRQTAHSTIEEFGSKLIDDLAAVPGAEAIRRDVVQRTLSYYQAFAQESNNDPTMQVSLANTYNRMGSLCEELGQADNAARNYQQADIIYSGLIRNLGMVTLDGMTQEELQCRAIDNRNHMVLSISSSRLQADDVSLGFDKLKFMQDTIAQSKRLSDESKSFDCQLQYALTLNNYAAVLINSAQLDAAGNSARTAIEILEKLDDLEPDDQGVLRGLSAAYHNLAKLTENAEQATLYFNNAIRYQLQLAKVSGNRIRCAPMLVTQYTELGNRYLNSKDYKKSEEAFELAAKIAEGVLGVAPDHIQIRQMFALARINQGTALVRSGNPTRAVELIAEGITNLQVVSKELPANLDLKAELLASQSNYAQTLMQMGRTGEAFAQFQMAYRLLGEIGDYSNRKIAVTMLENYLRAAQSIGKMEQVAELEAKLKSINVPASYSPTQKAIATP